jgi:SAM-dependent methyltransferase
MNSLEQWKRKNIEYYKDIERLYKFFIPEDSKVLELGSGSGDLLNSVNPVFGLGIDSNELAIEISLNKFPELEFQLQPAELFQCDKVFDYIILSNTISYLENIQQSLLNIYQVSEPSTKLIITFHNNGWELILRLATVFKQRMPIETLNWLDYEDIRNLLELGGFEVILHGKQMLCPRRIPFIFKIFNQFLAPLPIVNNLCLTEYIVAKPKPNNIVGKLIILSKKKKVN